MPKLQTRPLEWFKPDPTQPRKSFDPDEIDRLGDDMLKRGVLVPLIAREEGNHGIITDGGRRRLAAERKGMKELPVIIYEKPQSALEIKGIQLATEIHRAGLSDHERYLACTELMAMNPEWQYADLAKFLNMNPPAITKLMSVARCTVAWQEALVAGRVGITECYAVSSRPEAEQAQLLSEKLSGASRDDIVRSAKRNRNNGDKPSVKVSRVNFVLPSSGVRIVVSGAGQSLDDLHESLSESVREVRKARDQGQDIKAFQAVMSAKSKKRGE